MNGPRLQPRPIFQHPGFQRPIAHPSAPSQATTLAAVTCRMRQGEISRDRAIDDLNTVGRRYGWSQDWAQRIPLTVVDQTIARSNGCQSLISTLRGYGGHAGPVAGGVHSGGSGAGRRKSKGSVSPLTAEVRTGDWRNRAGMPGLGRSREGF